MRVLVCGGRDYADKARIFVELDAIKSQMTLLMSGGAKGADTFALDWGQSRKVQCERYMADWHLHGTAAGPIRNQRMLDKGKPDIVLAFGGNRGTTDMIRRAVEAGVPVIEFDRDV